MKHTPGPWAYDGLDRVIVKENVKDIAHMDRTASEADARLITAAPDLLEALKWYVERDEQIAAHNTAPYSAQTINNWRLLARAAIAKATGD
jgi:hypothetical protein